MRRDIKLPALWTMCFAITLSSLSSGAPVSSRALSAEGSAGSGSGYLYLLAGTPTLYSMYGYPVRLYTVSGGRLALVRQVSATLFAITDDLSGHLYVLGINRRAVSVIHENTPDTVDDVLPPKGKAKIPSFDFYYETWGAVAGPGIPAGVVFADWEGDRWTVTRVFGDATAGHARVTKGTWDLYRYFRYVGNGGGPYQYVSPSAEIEDGRIMLPYTLGPGEGDLGPIPSMVPPEAGVIPGYSGRPRAAGIVADTALFFAFYAPLPTAEIHWPRTVYLLNKATRRWSVIKVPFYGLSPRLFGIWLATTIAEPNPEGRESPGVENERANEVDVNIPTGRVRELPRVRGMYGTKAYMPGKLLLQNLVDDRKITIHTGQQDSEVLDVRKDGLVLYRVNDEIFSAQIEGDKLGPAKLVVKDDDVPEVHWAFWSHAGTELHSSLHGSAKH